MHTETAGRKGFILTQRGTDGPNGHNHSYFGTSEKGPFSLVFNQQRPMFFIEHKVQLPDEVNFQERKPLNLRNFSGKAVDAIYFKLQRDLFKARDLLAANDIKSFESDIRSSERFLMERFIFGGIEFDGQSKMVSGVQVFYNPSIKPATFKPNFNVVSIDIETGQKGQLYSIGLHSYRGTKSTEKVFMIGPVGEARSSFLTFVQNEKVLLRSFLDYFQELDPDVIIGWNVIGFDLKFLETKFAQWQLPFNLGRQDSILNLIKRKDGSLTPNMDGRVVLDGPYTLRGAFYNFESFKLDLVAKELLGIGKDIQTTTGAEKVQEIERRFLEDKESLAKYNLLDCQLVSQIFQKEELLELCHTRVCLSGMMLDRIGSSIAAFDYFYLPLLHRKGFVSINAADVESGGHAAGGYVMDSQVGLHESVVVLDFKSLYPSIIQTFKIDPLSRLKSDEAPFKTPVKYEFSSTEHILPDHIGKLLQERSQAKEEGKKYLSQAVKILMNSFYGIMGSTSSRFYHPNLPSAITGTGQWLLKSATKFFEDKEYKVIYGDTDSLFVKLKPSDIAKPQEAAEAMARSLNDFFDQKLKDEFHVTSYLQVEFEDYYRKLFLPPLRGAGNRGAKKRYAGVLVNGKVESIKFVGLESVRSDWTKLAKDFQRELFRKMFDEEDLVIWIKEFVEDVLNGKYDGSLIYKKRLTKPLEEYTKSNPPHVKAARSLEVSKKNVGKIRNIEYVMTLQGPTPIELDCKNIDYQHYIEKQIMPIADSVLSLQKTSFEEITSGKQLSLFH